MTKRLYVPLTDDLFKDLQAIAQRERRRVFDQAAVMLEQAVESSSAQTSPVLVATRDEEVAPIN